MTTPVRLAAFAAAAAVAVLGAGLPAQAAPLLLIDGSDTTVVVLDMGSRIRTGEVREASVYRGAIARGDTPRTITGERLAFDCPGRRERQVAVLTRREGDAPLRTPIEGPWQPIMWNTPMDFAAAAVCLNVYNRDRVSLKEDVTSILKSLEQVWAPGYPQPPRVPEPPPKRKRSLLRPF